MAADAWAAYDKFPLRMGDNTIDMDADSFKLALYTSASNAATLSVGTNVKADLTNELSNGNGYTTGGVAVSSVTWTESSGVITFDGANFAPFLTASGASRVFRFGVLWDDTPVSPTDPLVAMTTWDNTPADITIADGDDFNVNFNASGIFTMS